MRTVSRRGSLAYGRLTVFGLVEELLALAAGVAPLTVSAGLLSRVLGVPAPRWAY